MARLKVYTNNFSAGRIGRRADRRDDLERYQIALAEIENAIVVSQGGAIKRGGSEFLIAAQSDTVDTILCPFVSGFGDRYMLEFCDGTIRVLTEAGLIHTITPTDITAQHLPGLRFHADGDILWITHNDHLFYYQLRYTGPTSWALLATPFTNGPFLDENTTATTLTFGAVIGSGIAVTASAALFDALHVGAIFRVRHPTGAMPGSKWRENASAADGIIVVSAQAVYRANGAGTTGYNPPTHKSGFGTDGGVDWEYLHDGAGYVRITEVTGPTAAKCDILSRIPTTLATAFWAEGALSPKRGYPACGAIFEERAALGGSSYQRDFLFISRFGSAIDHKPGTGLNVILATDAFRARPGNNAARRRVQEITFLAGLDRLIVGCRHGIFAVQGSTDSEALAPPGTGSGGSRARPASRYGSAPIEPAIAGSTLFYVQTGGKILRQFSLATDTDGYGALNASILNPDLTRPGIAQLDYEGGEDGIVWMRRQDGQLLGMTFDEGEKVRAWHTHRLGGSYDGGAPQVTSMAVAPRDADDSDARWMIVRRTLGGVTRRTIEIQRPIFDKTDMRADLAWQLDCALRYDGWNADPAKLMTVTAASYAKGATVSIASNYDIFGAGGAQIGVGRTIGFGRQSLPAKAGDVWPARRLKITSVIGLRLATATLSDELPARYRSAATAEWGLGVSTMTGLSHLNGETVAVFRDGADDGTLQLAGGAITFSDPHPIVALVGLDYKMILETLNLSPQPGVMVGQKSQIKKLAIAVQDSVGGFAGQAGSRLAPIPYRRASEPYGTAPELRTEVVEIEVPSVTQGDVRVRIEHSGPMPFAVQAIRTWVESDAN